MTNLRSVTVRGEPTLPSASADQPVAAVTAIGSWVRFHPPLWFCLGMALGRVDGQRANRRMSVRTGELQALATARSGCLTRLAQSPLWVSADNPFPIPCDRDTLHTRAIGSGHLVPNCGQRCPGKETAHVDPPQPPLQTQGEEYEVPKMAGRPHQAEVGRGPRTGPLGEALSAQGVLSLIHISEPTRRTPISYAVF